MTGGTVCETVGNAMHFAIGVVRAAIVYEFARSILAVTAWEHYHTPGAFLLFVSVSLAIASVLEDRERGRWWRIAAAFLFVESVHWFTPY